MTGFFRHRVGARRKSLVDKDFRNGGEFGQKMA
jgi:hypothetical protein